MAESNKFLIGINLIYSELQMRKIKIKNYFLKIIAISYKHFKKSHFIRQSTPIKVNTLFKELTQTSFTFLMVHKQFRILINGCFQSNGHYQFSEVF